MGIQKKIVKSQRRCPGDFSKMEGLINTLRVICMRLSLLSPECFETLMVKMEFDAVDCWKMFISRGLGIAIIAGATCVKLPQIIKIAKSGSAKGISFTGTLLELVAVTANGAYSFSKGFPFNSYGATVFAITTPGLVPANVLWYGQAANIPMIVLGKMIQAIANFRQGHTGQLSALTVFLLALGSLARVFTSIQETGDSVVISTYICSTMVNLILAGQVLYYWNVDVHAKTDSKKSV